MKRYSILMLESDEDDLYITREYLENDFPVLQVVVVSNSEDLISSLKRSLHEKKALPDLLLLNYHSAPLNAAELLREIRRVEGLRHLPAVVLSGIKNDMIIRDCYQSGANSFIIKPARVEDIRRTIAAFVTYWFETVQLIE